MNNHPQIAELYKIYKSESQPFRKVHRMIDLFESIIKSHTVLIMTEYVKYNKLSDAAKGLLAQGLRTPSLGTWQLFSRVLFEELEKDNYPWLLPDFAGEFVTLDKALNVEKTNVIAFRNGYAHGATPIDAQCEADIKKFEPFLTQLLESKWLNTSSLEVRDNKVYLVYKAGEFSLHPMLLYRKEDAESSFAFFNDLKNDKIGLLNYPLSKHYREKDFFTEFHEHLPLNDWKKTGNNEFYQRIEELTETFKGRTIEREKLLQFVLNNHKGYFSIQGNPGIGKSALIAQFFKDLRSHAEVKKLKVIEYFIRRGTQQAQVEYMFNYLIRRTDEVFPAGKEIRAEGKMVFDLQSQLFAKWRLWGEQVNGQQLLFLIDGLDEGVENNVVTYLPRENFDNILIIYGSRPGGHKTIDDLWATLPVENHSKLELSGLGKEDIRALIYEVANKYEVERESAWIDAVQKRSQGNPLYLKLLCDAIENGSIEINDINALPEKIDEYYKAILQRYAQDIVDGDALLTGLFTFAAAKDYLTMAHLGLIYKLGSATVQRIGSTLKEVLYENPLTEEVLDYQLFHESFREYLVKEKAKEVSDAAGRIIDFCNTWQELEGSWEQRYPLEQYASHLFESKQGAHHETLIDLIYNKAFATEQMKTLKTFDASNRLYQLALLKASDLNKEDQMLEAALCLVDLKYEEANDATQVVAMVANGEMELALKRIERFGGADEEGVKRKFILYMLCLMELTLLNSKEKPFRKSAIEKLLNHLDEQIPADTSLIKWKDFFSSYTIFLMASEWAQLGLDYLIVYKRTDGLKMHWLPEKGPYSHGQFDVLLETTHVIDYEREKSSSLSAIASELAKQGKMLEAMETARGISYMRKKSSILGAISTKFFEQGNLLEADGVLKEAIETASTISNHLTKTYALSAISTKFFEQGNLLEADRVLKEAIEASTTISDHLSKSYALSAIASALTELGKVQEANLILNEALELARNISDDEDNISALNVIARNFFELGNIIKAHDVLKLSLETAHGIIDKSDAGDSLREIAIELAKLGKIEDALETAHGINHYGYKKDALSAIAVVLVKQDKVQEAIETVSLLNGEWNKSEALSAITTVLVKQGKVQEALEMARGIIDKRIKSLALRDISFGMFNTGKKQEAYKLLKEALETARGSKNSGYPNSALNEIATELANEGMFKESSCALQETLNIDRGISVDWHKCGMIRDISSELAKQGEILKALEMVRSINREDFESSARITIASELAKNGKIGEAMETARAIGDESLKIQALITVFIVMDKQGQGQKANEVLLEALETVSLISYEWGKSEALNAIAVVLVERGKIHQSSGMLQKILQVAHSIVNKRIISNTLITIATLLSNQDSGQETDCLINEALESARNISDEVDNISALSTISTELVKQGKVEKANSVIREVFETCRGIGQEEKKSRLLGIISLELVRQGKVQEAFETTRVMDDLNDVYGTLSSISSELAKNGKVLEALKIAHCIVSEGSKSYALKKIATELVKQGKLQEAVEVGESILMIRDRQECWMSLASVRVENQGVLNALSDVIHFKNDEVSKFYLKGWIKSIKTNECTNEILKIALHSLAQDTEAIERAMQTYALHELFFGKPSLEKINRLNRTLNIQWAIDIAAQFPKESGNVRLSTNLDNWLHEIEDEDDQDQIMLWAKQVTKGKITEEEFQTRIKDI